jgi:hypothetical protein
MRNQYQEKYARLPSENIYIMPKGRPIATAAVINMK